MLSQSIALPDSPFPGAAQYVSYHETGLTFAPDTPYDVWSQTLGTLQRIAGSVQWWIGDALQFGEHRYSETYTQAIEASGWGYDMVAKCKWVAGRYESCNRLQSLSWTHHAALADMEDVAERQRLLGQAADEQWSVNELRDERRWAELARQQEHEAAGDGASPPPPYRVVLADPPWQYDQRGANSPRFRGTTDRHYPTMTTEAIAALPVASVVAEDAILLLWTTWPFVPDALGVVESWGFRYVTGLPWVKADEIGTDFDGTVRFKPNKGVGYWFRGSSEPLIFAKRGTPKRRALPFDGILADRNIHSRKPTCVYDIAESLGAPCLELFARTPRPGWASLGNAINGLDVRDALYALAL